MVAVFGGFATGRLVMLQEMGFGLAVAVLLDATVVRSVLVPREYAVLVQQLSVKERKVEEVLRTSQVNLSH